MRKRFVVGVRGGKQQGTDGLVGCSGGRSLRGLALEGTMGNQHDSSMESEKFVDQRERSWTFRKASGWQQRKFLHCLQPRVFKVDLIWPLPESFRGAQLRE